MNPLVTIAANEPLQPIRGGTWKRVIASGDRLRVEEIFLEAGVDTADHGHDVHQVAYQVAGRFEVTIGGSTVVLGPGDGYAIPAHMPHRVRCIERGSYILATAVPTAGASDEPGHHHEHAHP
jgi:quercetin dioxygenase-like cupin family protein